MSNASGKVDYLKHESWVKNVGDRELATSDSGYLPAVVSGLGVTMRHLWRNLTKPKGESYMQTVQYPEEKREYPPRFRGLHRLVPRDDGSPRCTACFLCSTVCPARCIYIEAGERPDPTIEKMPVRFEIDELRCVDCGYCVEACPCDAIRMDTGIHPPPVANREEAILNLQQLLATPGLQPNGPDPLTTRHHTMMRGKGGHDHH